MIRVAVVVPIRDEQERDRATDKAISAARLLNDQYLTTFKGLVEFEARPFVVVDEHQNRSLFGFTYNRHHEILGDWPTHYVGFGGIKSGINGEAIVGGNRAWIYGSGTPRTIIHELGHCLGRGHSNRPSMEYGDMSDLMGKGPSGWHALCHREFGLIRPEHVQTITQGAAYLVPVECIPACVWPGECQMAVVNTDDGPLILSTRKGYGQHFDGAGDPEIIYIHQPEPKNLDGYRSTLLATLRHGDEYRGIMHDGVRDGVVRALVEIEDSSEYPEMVVRRGIEPGPFVSKIWCDHDHFGQGLDLHYLGRAGQEFVGFWYSHSVEGYKAPGPLNPKGDSGRRWYELEGWVDNGICRVKIKRRKSDTEMEVAGYGVIRFDAEDRAVFRFYVDDYGRDQFELHGFTSVRQGIKGGFTTGPKQGLTVGEFVHPDNSVQMTAFLYKPDDWLMCQGTPDNMTVYDVRSRYKAVLDGELIETGIAKFDGRTLTVDGNRKTSEPVF